MPPSKARLASARFALVFAVGALPACSSSSSSGGPETDASNDQTTPDSASDDGSPSEAAPSDGHGGDGPGTDAAPEAEASVSEAGPDAGPDADGGAGDGGDGGPACTPVDASVDAAAAAAGMNIVETYYCTGCHQNNLSGGLTVSGATSKNLTPDPATGLGCWTDPQIVTAILYGTTPEGDTLCVMPQWATTGFHGLTLDAGQAEQVVQYLRSIAPLSRVVAPTDCAALGFGDAGTDSAAADGGDAGSQDGGVEAGDGATE
jgi:hypothetical protein